MRVVLNHIHAAGGPVYYLLTNYSRTSPRRGFLASDVIRGRRVNLLFLLMSFGAWNSTMTSRPTPPFDLGSAHLRVARPTDRMEEVLTFYSKALGFKLFGRFKDHDGFDGIILSHEGAGYHLEFTRKHGHTAGSAPSRDHLLVFYVPGLEQWREAVARVESFGFSPVVPWNPYWTRHGRTYEDPDGYRVVIQNTRSPTVPIANDRRS